MTNEARGDENHGDDWLAQLEALRPTLLGPERSRSEARDLLAAAERHVAQDPAAAFTFGEGGEATLVTPDRRYAAGRFATRSVGSLRAELAARAPAGAASPPIRLSLIRGTDALFDIGALQAGAAPGTLFQVASQFNCLESPGPWVVPVRQYLSDSTQGPRASVSAFPGTLLRHYAAPGPEGRFAQRGEGPQLDLLGQALDPEVGEVVSGYLMTNRLRAPERLADALEASFERIEVGVHEGAEVALGANWAGAVPEPAPRIAQVFTSTLALGGYSRNSGAARAACRPLLRAAYLGTLLAALCVGARRVVLTLIGGGAFGNPREEIWAAIRWALEQADPFTTAPLEVIVNSRGDLDALLEGEVLPEVERRGGVVIGRGA